MTKEEPSPSQTDTFLYRATVWVGAFTLAFALLTLLQKPAFLWDMHSGIIVTSLRRLGVCGAIFLPLLYRGRGELKSLLRESLFLFPLPFLLLLFLSSPLCNPYSLFQGPSIRGELLVAFLGSLWAYRSRTTSWSFPLLLLCIVGALYSFFSTSEGRLLISDDHSTFFYRMQLLKEEFPRIPFYSPSWNGGIDARDFFASGALNFFFLFSPLIYAFPLEKVYNLLIVTLLFIVFPTTLYIAARREKIPFPALTALLGIGGSLLWYRWSLHFGTLGFITSTVLLPLSLSYLRQLIWDTETLTWKDVIFIVLLVSLSLFWSLMGIVLLPLALPFFLRTSQWIKNRKVLCIGALLLCLNLPWMTLFWSVSKVGSFISAEKSASHATVSSIESPESSPSPQKDFRHRTSKDLPTLGLKALKSFREWSVATNPLLLIGGISGLLLLEGSFQPLLLYLCPWLLFLGTIGVSLKPQLELDRMLVVMGVLFSFPTAAFLGAVIQRKESFFNRFYAGLCGAFLFITPFTLCSILLLKRVQQFSFLGPNEAELITLLKKYGGDGRTLFLGCVIHEWGGGHLAPLSVFTGQQLMASSQVHNLWRYKEAIPEAYLSRGEEGITQYLNLYNITAVAVHESKWVRYLRARPEEFQEEGQAGKFLVFTRKHPPSSYVLQGEAKDVRLSLSSVELTPLTPEVTLSLNYFPFIESSQCTLEAAPQEGEITFIRLTSCTPNEPVIIRAKTPWTRILP